MSKILVRKGDRTKTSRHTGERVPVGYRVHYEVAGQTHKISDEFDTVEEAAEHSEMLSNFPGVRVLEGPSRPDGIETIEGWEVNRPLEMTNDYALLRLWHLHRFVQQHGVLSLNLNEIDDLLRELKRMRQCVLASEINEMLNRMKVFTDLND